MCRSLIVGVGVVMLLACAPPDSAPEQFAAAHPKVKDAVEDVYIWVGIYSLPSRPDEIVINEVSERIRRHVASRDDLDRAYQAQVSKRKVLAGLFDDQQRLHQLANDQSRVAQAIRDAEIRRAAVSVAQNTQRLVETTERWADLQARKGAWSEALFAALRDHSQPPDGETAKRLNAQLGEQIASIERLHAEHHVLFAEFQGVKARKRRT